MACHWRICATFFIRQFLLAGMLKRRRGAIVNIGSAAATVLPADPLYSLYAGTKG
jgi:17beta-estradiol 17-dehydrogenase / very-long-chain 3-oxoacyl-CoA reductase